MNCSNCNAELNESNRCCEAGEKCDKCCDCREDKCCGGDEGCNCDCDCGK